MNYEEYSSVNLYVQNKQGILQTYIEAEDKASSQAF